MGSAVHDVPGAGPGLAIVAAIHQWGGELSAAEPNHSAPARGIFIARDRPLPLRIRMGPACSLLRRGCRSERRTARGYDPAVCRPSGMDAAGSDVTEACRRAA